jgi:hypothetical protein
VIQEYVQPTKEPKYYFGPCCLDPGEVTAIIEEGNPSWIGQVANSMTKKTTTMDFALRQELFKMLRAPELKFDLLYLLSIISQTVCGDPKDKVYSIHSLLQPEERRHIKVDYRKETSLVFAEATCAAIWASGNFDRLAFIRHGPERNPDLKSWMLDFNLPPSRTNLKDYSQAGWFSHGMVELAQDWFERLDMRPSHLVQMRREILDCSGDAKRSWCHGRPPRKEATTFDPTRMSFSMKALRFDQIISIAEFHFSSQKSAIFREADRAERSPKTSIRHAFATSGNPYALLQKGVRTTLTLQGYRSANNEGLLNTGESLKELFKEWNKAVFGGFWGRLKLGGFRDSFDAFFKQYLGLLGGRPKLILTKCGFLGCATWDTQTGDNIVLPYGSRWPVVFRSRGRNTWTFESLAAVHGIMEGELAQEAPNLVLEEAEYELV